MQKFTVLTDYSDDQGNSISSPTRFEKNIAITIRGSNNRIIVDRRARINKLTVIFDCDNGAVIIGPSSRRGFSMSMQLGQDSTVRVGADVTTTASCVVNAAEGATVIFGNDVMIASENQFRAHDGHPIVDVGRRGYGKTGQPCQ